MMEKINWISILQGWSMLLVVVGHIALTDNIFDPNYPISSKLYAIIYSFHMPLFIFISGWLVFYTSISKDKPYKIFISSKFTRLCIPFYAFTAITIIIKSLFGQFVKNPITTLELYKTFVLYSTNPLKELWFLIVLMEMMLLYPILKKACDNKLLMLLVVVISILIYFNTPLIREFQIYKFSSLLFFFISGILFAKYELAIFLNGKYSLLLLLSLFVVVNIFNTEAVGEWGFLNNTIGILFSVSLCLNVDKLFPNLFSSFRNYTFQIYLIGMYPQFFLRIIYLKCNDELLYPFLFVISILSGLYLPVLFARFMNTTPGYLKKLIGL